MCLAHEHVYIDKYGISALGLAKWATLGVFCVLNIVVDMYHKHVHIHIYMCTPPCFSLICKYSLAYYSLLYSLTSMYIHMYLYVGKYVGDFVRSIVVI